jgi:mycothiol synthase
VAETARPQLHMRRELVDLPRLVVPPGYELRAMEPSDVTAWVELLNRNGELGEWSAARAAPIFEGGEADPARSFVVVGDGRPLATAQLAPHADDRYAPTPELGWVAAAPDARGRGLGRLVCLAVMRAAAEAGHARIFLRTDDHRLPAIRTYLRLGFEPWLVDPTAEARWRAVMDGVGSVS